ncbi:AraC family transcriptional regulator, partial [Dysgonomonas sp. Marseille-P4677]|uniref:helix-turn-helix domain-containing protein n=1 Tax=Dysgonomonas sp. Marseille-P4677 TaxID=2364790 RepID=UPI0019138149
MFTSTLGYNKNKNNNQPSKDLYVNKKEENILIDFFNSSHILNPNLDIKIVSRILNISQKHLTDLIKQNYSSTFFKILTAKRIEKACQFIIDENFNYEYESLYIRCGLKSKATFYRNFLFIKGCTPSQYR